MRIGYVVKRYPRFSETFIVNEILAHEAAGLEVEIISIRPCNDTHFQDRIAKVRAPLTQLPSGAPKANALIEIFRESAKTFPHLWQVVAAQDHADAVSLHQAVLLATQIRESNISHLHAHFATLPATVARLAAKIAGITYSLTAHAKDIYHDSVAPDDLRIKLCDADAVITVSDYNVAHLQQEFPTCAKQLHRVYNGMDLDALPFVQPIHRDPVILGVGRLVEKKGFDDLLRACDILRQRNVSFLCRIVGGGEEESRLRAMVEELQLHGKVEMTGPIPQVQLKALVQQAAVMAAPCVVGGDGNRDGLPTVLLEAMALGTPCVATDVTGIPEVIRHELSGLIVPQRNPAAIAAAIQRCFEDEALCQQLAAESRKIIEQEFDSRATSAQIREIFAAAVKAGTASPSTPSSRQSTSSDILEPA